MKSTTSNLLNLILCCFRNHDRSPGYSPIIDIPEQHEIKKISIMSSTKLIIRKLIVNNNNMLHPLTGVPINLQK